ncbi:hypothetical protein CANTEDRAFT_131238 [Yamadazyma tenuis ATCC 10573]|uniref:MICOS complex subunit MIC60 n=1 Tax=Candida tenuis (strain ATCC 10573 / BCRC 21748 / CBS 615 / JCM 9827 / NBRC 10315 / NRRL Y-1498 / VKM Y-70) TaxID=590646 RepID=G3B8C1_CANTC|nr:uncharacterized protein CANTEDRAFT_131238 [Yamadazyma tenuis ATCC 10573]EGV61736.1 hypothetical protein CANTEDRAFT_131238 [Yamadazyma tenuis ATCC 10573]
MSSRSCAVSARRALTSSAKRLNDVKKPVVPPPRPAVTTPKPVITKPVTTPVPKPVIITKPSIPPPKFSIPSFLFKIVLAGGVVYGGTMYAATKSDTVMDFVIDQQLPYYEEIIDIYEKGSIDDVKDYFAGLGKKVSSWEAKLPSKDEITSKGEKIFEETKNKLSPPKPAAPVDVSSLGQDATPAQQLQKPVEAVKKTVEHFPLIQLNKSVSSAVDASVKQTVESFNDLIRSIDVDASNTPGKDTLIKAINENVSKLATKLSSLTVSFEEEVQSKLRDSQTDLLSSYTKKELELTETLLDQFNSEKAQLEVKLNNRLKHEIEATKQTISQAAVNAVSMVRVEQTKQFEKLIKDSIDSERNGRLAGLEQLNARVKDLEEFSETLETQLVANHTRSVLSKAVGNLKHVLASSKETDSPKLLIQYFDEINKVAGSLNSELLNVVLNDLKPLIVNESNHSLLTNAQLLNKWEQLTPELRSASLLPPNAGLLGHLASMVFSKLLLPVKGNKPDGKDIESVIGRIESALTRGDLDVAVEEAANLKGWPRKLADDWVKDGRKRLEVQFLVGVVDSETRIV